MRTLLISLGLAMGLVGCSQTVDRGGDYLVAVDEDRTTSSVLYMAPEVSAVPLTEDDLTALGMEAASAVPVRVEVWDDVAVAFFAPEGDAIISRDTIVALWDVVDRTPIVDETRVGGTEQVNLPGTLTAQVVREAPGGGIDLEVNVDEDTRFIAIIDFFDQLGGPDQNRYINRVTGHHPGC